MGRTFGQGRLEIGKELVYAGPPHIRVHVVGTRVPLFSPTEPLHQTSTVITENARRLQAG